jgi:hypothetical protein
MEIALNSLLIFLLLVFPGIVYRRFYYVGEFSKQFNSSNWINTFYISLIPGIIIQIFSYFIFVNVVYRKPITNHFLIINKVYEKIKAGIIPEELFNLNTLSWIITYFLINIIVAFIIAQICWTVVRSLDLDKKYAPLRFNNYWHYYLSGESLKFKDFKGILNDKKVVLTEADVLMDLGDEGTKLYKGFVRQHTICKTTGDLKSLYLTDVRRYTRDPAPNNIKHVPGHIMIIPAEKIININLTYITKKGNNINYLDLFNIVINLSVLLFLMSNPSHIFLRNTTVFGDIIGRFWLFLAWLFFAVLVNSIIGLKKDPKLKEAIYGSITLIIFVSLIIYFFFYK